jgi:hypothetical protein
VATADEVTDPYDLLLGGYQERCSWFGPGGHHPGDRTKHADRAIPQRHVAHGPRFGANAVLGGVVKVASTLDERGHSVTLGPGPDSLWAPNRAFTEIGWLNKRRKV